MPTLVIDFLGKRKRVRIEGRASIGRTKDNDVRIDHPAISRTHAQIDSQGERYFFQDVGSANGTLIDGSALNGRRELDDGAQIVIGPATLTFHSDDAVIDTTQPERKARTQDGILLDCSCGAKLWVPEERIGGTGKCRRCGASVSLGEKQVCSICQWEMTADAKRQECPDCGLTFHAECWQENLGCSAYGCPQVNVLADPRDAQVHDEEIGAPPAFDRHRGHTRWERPLLASSVAASLLGILAFGAPALIVAIVAAIYLSRHLRRRHTVPIMAACIIISSIGLAAGIAVSGYWWLGWTLVR